MPFSFPSSPSVGQTSTQNGRSYTYAGNGVWELTPASGGGGPTWSSVPASPTATGTAGSIAYDNANGFFYVATAQNSWRRAALSTWVTDPLFSSVSTLLHFDGTNGSTTFSDSSSNAISYTGTAATISTAQSKFGGASGAFAGSGYLVSAAANAAFGMGTGDFCVEAWVYVTSNSSKFNTLVSLGTYESGILWRLGGTSGISSDWLYINGTAHNYGSSSNAVSANTWTHVALSRSGGTVSVYIGGTRIYTASSAGNAGSSQQLYVGAAAHAPTESTGYFSGYIDELRITKNSDRGYTGSTITVPTAAFPDS